MKKAKQKITFVTLIVLLSMQIGFANEPKYKISSENVKHTSSNSLEFDIYMQHTNSNESKFTYIAGQYLFDFNPKIANGGSLTYSIVSSELPENLRPGNASVAGSILRLAANSIPSAEDNLFTISEKAPGTLIARMKLETSAKEFSDSPLELNCRMGPDNLFTKICFYDGKQISEIKGTQVVVTNNSANKNEELNSVPKEFALSQNYPNPFNPTTNIKFDIPKLSNVKLSIYDITGREIAVLANEQLQPGNYNYKFEGSNFASGVYFYKITAGEFSRVKKMVLIK